LGHREAHSTDIRRRVEGSARAFGPTCSADGQRVACLGAAQTFRIQQSGGFAGDSEATTPISNVSFSPYGNSAMVLAVIRVPVTQKVERWCSSHRAFPIEGC
jgi:hypothetical protein